MIYGASFAGGKATHFLIGDSLPSRSYKKTVDEVRDSVDMIMTLP
jgi:hypothetical protein